MKKALLVTTVSGFVPQFEMNNVRILQEMGYEVHYASNFNYPSYGTDNKKLDNTGITQHQIDFVRSPFAIMGNIRVYKQLKKLMNEIRFDLVHCHTPMGGAMARIVAKKTNTKPVLYTVHGLHFYKGAPLINWLIYYPVEKFLSKYTDTLITINYEDYHRAKKFHAKKIQYIPGVGIDCKKIKGIDSNQKLKKNELGINENTTIFLSAGELIKRKNYETALKAFARAELPNAVYLICGHGILEAELKELANHLGIKDKVLFLGYRNDLIEIMKCADIFFFPSFQEGLPVALMEAMACGLPIICSEIRGNIDLISQNVGGYLCKAENIDGFSCALQKLSKDFDERHKMGEENIKRIHKFDLEHVSQIMRNVYSE